MKSKVLLAVVMLLLVATPVFGERLGFFSANSDGYRTVLGLSNPTSQDISVPGFYEPIGVGSGEIVVPARGFLRYEEWPRPGQSGVYELEVPEGLSAYVEVEEPAKDGGEHGVRYRIPGLRPIPDFAMGLINDLLGPADGYTPFLLFGSPQGAVATVITRGSDYALHLSTEFEAGKLYVTPAGPGILAAAVVPGAQVGPFTNGRVYAAGLISKQPGATGGGELIIIPAEVGE